MLEQSVLDLTKAHLCLEGWKMSGSMLLPYFTRVDYVYIFDGFNTTKARDI